MASVQPAVEGLGQVVSAAEPEPVKTRSERDLGLGPDRAIRSGTTPRSSALLGLDVARLIEAAERSRTHDGHPCFLDWRTSAAP